MSADTKVIYVGLGNAAVLVALILAVYFSDIPAVFMGGGEAVHESYSYWTFMLGAFVCAFILAPIPGAVLMRRAKVKHAILISVFSELELFLLMILVLRFFSWGAPWAWLLGAFVFSLLAYIVGYVLFSVWRAAFWWRLLAAGSLVALTAVDALGRSRMSW